MNEDKIVKILNKFSEIKPSEDFSIKSRSIILNTQKGNRELYKSVFNFSNIIRNVVRDSMRIVSFATISAVIIFGIYMATKELSPLFLPGLNKDNVVAEAEMVKSSIDIQLNSLKYFDEASKQGGDALTQITEKSFNHLNKTILNEEMDSVKSLISSSTADELNSKIDDLIDKAAE
jgi:hypothetical protein